MSPIPTLTDADLFAAWSCHLAAHADIRGNQARAAWIARREELAAEINGRSKGRVV